MGMRITPSHAYLRSEVDFIETQAKKVCEEVLKKINPMYSSTLFGIQTWAIKAEREEWNQDKWVACGIFAPRLIDESSASIDFWEDLSNISIVEMNRNLTSPLNIYSVCPKEKYLGMVPCTGEHEWETWPVSIAKTTGYPAGEYASENENFEAIKTFAEEVCSDFAKSKNAKDFYIWDQPSTAEWRIGVTELGCTIRTS
jgi:hypothetical protein